MGLWVCEIMGMLYICEQGAVWGIENGCDIDAKRGRTGG